MVDGVSVKLEAFELYGGSLAFLFRDKTSDTVSYGAGRELYADAPSKGLKEKGAIILDFNQASIPRARTRLRNLSYAFSWQPASRLYPCRRAGDITRARLTLWLVRKPSKFLTGEREVVRISP